MNLPLWVDDPRSVEVVESFDSGLGMGKVPVTLVLEENDDGTLYFDLHAQTGEGHAAAIERARAKLAKRGLLVGKAEFMGPTGIYYSVKEAQ